MLLYKYIILYNPVHRYGRFMSEVSYFICHERETIDTIFNNLRGNRKVWHMYVAQCLQYLVIVYYCWQYPLKCGCSKVVSVLDLTTGYDSTRPPHYKPVSMTRISNPQE